MNYNPVGIAPAAAIQSSKRRKKSHTLQLSDVLLFSDKSDAVKPQEQQLLTPPQNPETTRSYRLQKTAASNPAHTGTGCLRLSQVLLVRHLSRSALLTQPFLQLFSSKPPRRKIIDHSPGIREQGEAASFDINEPRRL